MAAQSLGSLTEIVNAINQTSVTQTRITEINNAANTAKENAISSINTKKTESIQAVQDVVDSIPEDYSELTEEVDQISSELSDKMDEPAGEKVVDYIPKLKENADGTLSPVWSVDESSSGGGMSTTAANLLITILKHCVNDGQSSNIEALEQALKGSSGKTLSSISATYSGGSVASGTATSELTGITVIGTYSDESTEEITGYALSPDSVSSGVNTITVTYLEKTCTFEVTGTASHTSKNLVNPAQAVRGTWLNGASDTAEQFMIVVPVIPGHTYYGMAKSDSIRQKIYIQSNLGQYVGNYSGDIYEQTIPTDFTYTKTVPSYMKTGLFGNSSSGAITIPEDATINCLMLTIGHMSSVTYGDFTASDLMIYDYTVNGQLTSYTKFEDFV